LGRSFIVSPPVIYEELFPPLFKIRPFGRGLWLIASRIGDLIKDSFGLFSMGEVLGPPTETFEHTPAALFHFPPSLQRTFREARPPSVVVRCRKCGLLDLQSLRCYQTPRRFAPLTFSCD